ncbi:MAG: hypothetical protein ACK5KP_10380, partial [Paludibacteraceae bacterium]
SFSGSRFSATLFATDFKFNDNNDRIGYYPFARIAYRLEPVKIPMLFSAGVDMPFYTPGSGLNFSFGIITSISIGYRF